MSLDQKVAKHQRFSTPKQTKKTKQTITLWCDKYVTTLHSDGCKGVGGGHLQIKMCYFLCSKSTRKNF